MAQCKSTGNKRAHRVHQTGVCGLFGLLFESTAIFLLCLGLPFIFFLLFFLCPFVLSDDIKQLFMPAISGQCAILLVRGRWPSQDSCKNFRDIGACWFTAPPLPLRLSNPYANSRQKALQQGGFLSCHYYPCYNWYFFMVLSEAQAPASYSSTQFFRFQFFFSNEVARALEPKVAMGSEANLDTDTDKS